MWLKKALYLLFYKIYHFWESVSDDNWSDWKTLVVIGKIQILLLTEFYVWWTIITKKDVDFSKYWLIIPVFTIAILNYYYFLHNNQWKDYEQEFRQYSKVRSKFLGWLVFLFLIGVLGSLIFAFYQMSLIDWSKYR